MSTTTTSKPQLAGYRIGDRRSATTGARDHHRSSRLHNGTRRSTTLADRSLEIAPRGSRLHDHRGSAARRRSRLAARQPWSPTEFGVTRLDNHAGSRPNNSDPMQRQPSQHVARPERLGEQLLTGAGETLGSDQRTKRRHEEPPTTERQSPPPQSAPRLWQRRSVDLTARRPPHARPSSETLPKFVRRTRRTPTHRPSRPGGLGMCNPWTRRLPS